MAIELFAREGYAATGISSLCKRARIAPTAIYWHFGNKEGLLAASLERAATLWTESIYKRASEPVAPEERLDQLVAGIRYVIESHGDELALLLSAELQAELFGAEVRAALRRIDERALAYLIRGFEEALEDRVPQLDLAALTVLAHLREIAVRYRRDRDPVELTRMLTHCKQMIAAALIVAVQNAQEPHPPLPGDPA